MADKKGVIMFYDILDQLEDFNDKDFREIIKAVINYDKDGTLPEFTGEKKIAFKFIKVDIDKNNEEYRKKCEQNRANISKRWNTKDTTEYDRIQTNIDKDIDLDIDKDIDLEKENNIKENTHTLSDLKEQKHKYGEYQHILLKDSELEKLKEEYGESETEKAIKYLDEYIEMKGAKYKSHYLAMRKWVFSALKEHSKKSNFATHKYSQEDLDGLFDNLDNVKLT